MPVLAHVMVNMFKQNQRCRSACNLVDKPAKVQSDQYFCCCLIVIVA